MHMCACARVWVCMCVCMHVCACAHVWLCMCVCTCVWMGMHACARVCSRSLIFSVMSKCLGRLLEGHWSERSLFFLQPPPLAQPVPLPQVLAPKPMGPLQPVPPHLPPYLTPTSQVAPVQPKPVQMPPVPLQPLTQVPPQVPTSLSCSQPPPSLGLRCCRPVCLSQGHLDEEEPGQRPLSVRPAIWRPC